VGHTSYETKKLPGKSSRIVPRCDIVTVIPEQATGNSKMNNKSNQSIIPMVKHFSEKIINTSNLVNFEIIFFLIGRSSGRLLFDF